MYRSSQSLSRQVVSPLCGLSGLKTLFCGLALSAVLAGVGSAANATTYNEAARGDLSDLAGSPTDIGTLTIGNNFVVGSSVPSGDMIPNGHGALVNQDNDFFTFTVPTGHVLSNFNLGTDTSISPGDRFFLGIYPGNTSPVDPSNPTPIGLLGYALPGDPQIGTDLLPALAASNDPGFPSLPQHFSGSLGAGEYTVWVVDGDRPLGYDLNLVVASAAPEPGTWLLMLAAVGLTGVVLRQRRWRPTPSPGLLVSESRGIGIGVGSRCEADGLMAEVHAPP